MSEPESNSDEEGDEEEDENEDEDLMDGNCKFRSDAQTHIMRFVSRKRLLFIVYV